VGEEQEILERLKGLPEKRRRMRERGESGGPGTADER
jgi:hypothetical protein